MKLKKFIQENRTMVYSAVVALIAIGLVLVFIRREVDRFIFIMPVFAGWILFNILMLPDEEDRPENNHQTKKRGKAL